MYTEDYLMRIINQALAALMTAIGLRKAGNNSEALQAVEQAIEQLTTLPANLIGQMDDGIILSMLSTQGQLDIDRLAILADLCQEEGEILYKLEQQAQSFISFARALRFTLEVVLTGDDNLSSENIGKVDGLVQRLKGRTFPADTQLALSDYYQRLLETDDLSLNTAGTSRKKVSQALAELQDQLGSI